MGYAEEHAQGGLEVALKSSRPEKRALCCTSSSSTLKSDRDWRSSSLVSYPLGGKARQTERSDLVSAEGGLATPHFC